MHFVDFEGKKATAILRNARALDRARPDGRSRDRPSLRRRERQHEGAEQDHHDPQQQRSRLHGRRRGVLEDPRGAGPPEPVGHLPAVLFAFSMAPGPTPAKLMKCMKF